MKCCNATAKTPVIFSTLEYQMLNLWVFFQLALSTTGMSEKEYKEKPFKPNILSFSLGVILTY